MIKVSRRQPPRYIPNTAATTEESLRGKGSVSFAAPQYDVCRHATGRNVRFTIAIEIAGHNALTCHHTARDLGRLESSIAIPQINSNPIQTRRISKVELAIIIKICNSKIAAARVGRSLMKRAVALTQQHSDGGSFVRGRAEVRNHKVHVSVPVEVRRRDIVRKDSADRKFSCRQEAACKCAGHEQEYSGANNSSIQNQP